MRENRSGRRARGLVALTATFVALHAGCGDDLPVFPGPAASGSSGTTAGTPAQSVTGGDAFSCSLREDRQVSCWGNDFYLQASPEQAPIFSILPSDGPFENVVAGGQHGCMRTRSFTLMANPPKPNQQIDFAGDPACWGNNNYNQIDHPNRQYRKMASGSFHSCGTKFAEGSGLNNSSGSDKRPDCWGRNDFGQASAPNERIHVRVQSMAEKFPSGSFTLFFQDRFELDEGRNALALGGLHSCGLLDWETRARPTSPGKGTVLCWGDNSHSQSALVGRTPKVDSIAPPNYEETFVLTDLTGAFAPGDVIEEETSARWTAEVLPTSAPPTLIVTRLSGTQIQPKDLINNVTQAGTGEVSTTDPGATGPHFISVAAGHAHTCAIYDETPDTAPYEGPISCWGQEYASTWPLPLPGGTPGPGEILPPAGDFRVIKAAIGAREGDGLDTFTCAIDSLGSIQCWGSRPNGMAPEPPQGTGYYDLAVGWDHICAVQRPLFLYEFRSGGQVLGTLTLDIETVDGLSPAWSGTDWTIAEAADIVSIELDPTVFGLGSDNILDIATMGIFQGVGRPPIGATIAANGDSLLSSGRIQDEPVTPAGDSPYFKLTFSSTGGQDEVTTYRDPNVPLGPPGTVNLPGLTIRGDWVRKDLGGTVICEGLDAEGQASPPS